MYSARRSAIRAFFAFTMSVLLAFSAPAPALADLATAAPSGESGVASPDEDVASSSGEGGKAPSQAADNRGIKSAKDADGNTWYYRTTDSKNYLTGFKKAEPAPEPVDDPQPGEGGTDSDVEPGNAAQQGGEPGSAGADEGGATTSGDTGSTGAKTGDGASGEADEGASGEAPSGGSGTSGEAPSGGSGTSAAADPGASGQPGEGDKPTDPADPAAPDKPAEPGEPSEPDKPAEPDPVDLGILAIPDVIGSGDSAIAVYGVSADWGDLAEDESGNTIEDSEASSWGDFVQVTIGAGIREIGDKAFVNCSNLETVAFSEGSKLTSIGKKAFLNCEALVSISFTGAQVTSIGEKAFAKCTQLRNVRLPRNSALKTIGPRAFSECSRLASITQLETSNLQSVGANAFEYSGLTAFKMPESLKSIGRMAFVFCDKLTSVTISKGFAGAYELSDNGKMRSDTCYNPFCGAVNARYHVPVEGADNYQTANDGYALVSRGGTYLYAVSSKAVDATGSFAVKLDASGSTRAANVQLIAESAFAYNKALTSIDIAETVKYVNKYAFMYSGVKRVTIPASVEYLRSECFSECDGLESVTLKEGVTKALVSGGKSQFANCRNLKSLELPSTLAGLSEGCFKGSGLTGVSIPAGITSIPKQAFATTAKSSAALARVAGCASLTRIEPEAFAGQEGITSFAFGGKVEFVSGTAFSEKVVAQLPGYLCEQADGYYRFETKIPITGWESYERADRALVRINKLRADAGLEALEMDADLMAAAMKRAAELTVRFASMGEKGTQAARPIGLAAATVSPKVSGEAIAVGHLEYISENSAISVVKDFMGQECWEELFMGPYQSAGIGCYLHNGELFWSVLFGGKADEGARAESGAYVDREASYDIFVNSTSSFPALSAELSIDEAQLAPEMEEEARVVVQCVNASKVANGSPNPKDTFDFSIPADQQRIATVDEEGVLTVRQGGTVTVTATLKGTARTAECTFTIAPQEVMSESGIVISGVVDKTYTGQEIVQSPVVRRNGTALEEGFDYEVSYSSNKEAGTATCLITGINNYEGAIARTFTIGQAAQTVVASGKNVTVSLKKVAKKKRKIASPVTVTSAIGKVTYANVSTQKIAKKLKVKAVNGKITVPKGKKARTYKVKIQVRAAGSGNYKPAVKKVAFKIFVK